MIKILKFTLPCATKCQILSIFYLTYDFDTDLLLSTSCSQLISGEPLVSCIHSTYIFMVAFALIPLKKTWNCNLFVFNFFSTFLFNSQHYTEKNQNKYLTLQLDSLIAVIILNIVWPEHVHLRTPFFTADNCREVVIQR